MLSKTKRARTAKTSARRKTSKKTKSADAITAEEVVSLELEAARHSRSEKTWLNMTAAPHSNDEDHWSGVEEHLLAKGQQEESSERRWKYFAK